MLVLNSFFLFLCGFSHALAAPLLFDHIQHAAAKDRDTPQNRNLRLGFLPPPRAPSKRSQTSESFTDVTNSTDISGTIDILLFNSPTQRLGSLTFAPMTADKGSYVLNVSNTAVPTQFLLHREDDAPPVSDHPNWTPVSLRVPLNASSAATSPVYCAEFQTGPGSSAPVVVRPCVQGWDASTTGSQLFVYDIVSRQISPYWPSLLNNTNGYSTPSFTPPADSNGAHSRINIGPSNMARANLYFTPSSPSPSTSETVTFVNTRPDKGDPEFEDDDDDLAIDDSGDESTIDGSSNTGDTPSGLDLVANDGIDPNANTGDTNPSPSSPHPPTILAAATNTDPSPTSVPSTVPVPTDPTAPCSNGDVTCIGDQFAECVGEIWVLTTCGLGTVCRIVSSEWENPGIGVIGPACDLPEDSDAVLRNGEGS